MKILVATGSGGLKDNVSPAFGRCASYTVVESAEGKITAVAIENNPFASAAGGAGIQAAQYAVDKKVKAVIAGNFGPNASDVLTQAGIDKIAAQGNVKDVVERYVKGALKPVSGPTAPLKGGLSQDGSPGQATGPGFGMGFGGGMGRGMGMGRGGGMRGGRGMGIGRSMPVIQQPIETVPKTGDEQIALLEEQVGSLATQLVEVKRKLDELKKK
ncbi:MAG: NifB/NifX family molybdenum-iron cluster-binding protein [Candidatus Altiarchaeota archaeon]|nr:NifB/NifX family molybdenum-iron cluster-binding protein [Candidatus Altiarchaeota archaeon]